MGMFSGPRRSAAVAESQPERAMTWPYPSVGTFANATVAGTGARASVAVQAATDLICSLVSELPVDVYSGSTKITTPPNIDNPGADDMGREDWTYRLLGSWLHRGNAYGQPLRDRLGYLRGLDLFNPDEVGVTLLPEGVPDWTVNGKPTPDLYHSRVNPMAGILLGFSPVEANAITILSAIAGTRYAHQWFTEGTHPQMLLVNTVTDLSAEQTATVLARWRAMKSGTREPAVMGRGWEARGLNITPEQAQLLELIGASEAQACRIFGPGIAETLGYDSGGSMTYANVQDRRSDLLVLSIGKWVRRVERVLTAMLPRPQWVQFNRDALLETTTMARYQAHQVALAAGFKLINEVRDDEDLPPVPWGDDPPKAGPTTTGRPAA